MFPLSMSHEPPRGHASIEVLLTHAAEHARNRLLHSCEAIAWIGGLAFQWNRRGKPVFTIKGAKVQDSSAGTGEQAAHVLPGQILIDGKPPWSLATGDRMKVAWLARFMVTSPVPTAFNTADSAAEKAGLKEAFRNACEAAWNAVVNGQPGLIPAYEGFLADADRSFLRAVIAKADKRDAAFDRNEVAVSNERLIENVILRAYRANGVTAKDANTLFPLRQI
jgi:hypothetical protein